MNARFRQIIVIILASLFIFSAMPREAAAFPYVIEGYLKNSDGVPITLAEIKLKGSYFNMTVQDMREEVLTTETDGNGYYRITPDIGYTGFIGDVIISYEHGDDVVSKRITPDETKKGTWVNLTYDKETNLGEILFSPVGLASIIILVAVIIIIIYMKRPEKEEEETEDRKNIRRRNR